MSRTDTFRAMLPALALLAAAATPGRATPADAAPAGTAAPAATPASPGSAGAASSAGPRRPTAEDARAFVARVNAELRELVVRAETASWIRNTYITDDTERNAAAMDEDLMAYLSRAIPEAAAFDGVPVDADTGRMLRLLKLKNTLPAPRDPALRRELASAVSRMEGLYGKGRWCTPARDGKPERCRDIQATEEIFLHSRDPDALAEAWKGWSSVGRDIEPLYERLVTLGNQGAREIGFTDMGQLWRSGYDMTPEELEADVDRLWGELQPFYRDLHCYVRRKLQGVYGNQRVPDGKPIPAQLVGNVWAQEWQNVYPLAEPYPGVGSIDLTAALKRQKYDAVKMVRRAESFFTSLGLDPLPATFWQRSMFTKPRDREVVCHASAWDVTWSDDLRIKMCIRPIEEDFVVIHHEMGHNYYQHAYVGQPFLFQGSANDGFHEALGDTISPLSMTPSYLARVGLVARAAEDRRAVINHQMKNALEAVALLPWTLIVDRWRWEVFSGKVPPDRWNARWWELRRQYQGVEPPSPPSAKDFDPGAKYHVPANVPYLRYFLARIYQYQFHQALCAASGWQGPLHACSIYGSKEAGRRLQAMMAMGESRPWQDAMEALTGQRRADVGPLLTYYAPLRDWLREQNAGQACGW